MPGFIGFWELAALAAVLLLLFGPKRLPEVGRSLGKGIREFKESITSTTSRFEAEGDEEREPIDAAQADDRAA